MRFIQKPCKFCNKSFLAETKELNRGFGLFCSRACSGKHNGEKRREKFEKLNKPNVSCAQCSKPFYKSIAKQSQSRSGLFFCTRACKDIAQRIGGIREIMPPHYGVTKSVTSYRKVALRNLPHICNRCSFESIPKILQVHHKDRDKTNSALSNLEILCPNCHATEHLNLSSN
jgi:hypothetical protein